MKPFTNKSAFYIARAWAALLFLGIPTFAYGADLGELIVVDDAGNGLVSRVELIPPRGVEHAEYVGATSQDGRLVMKPTLKCPQRHRVLISVPQGRFFPKELECSQVKNPHKQVLTGWAVIVKLYGSYKGYAGSQDYAGAALMANEIGARLQGTTVYTLVQTQKEALTLSDLKTKELFSAALRFQIQGLTAKLSSNKASPTWSTQAIKMAGKSLGIENNSLYYDPLQNRVVMSGALADALKKFQRTQSLEATGTLDYLTLNRLSNKNISPHLSGKVYF